MSATAPDVEPELGARSSDLELSPRVRAPSSGIEPGEAILVCAPATGRQLRVSGHAFVAGRMRAILVQMAQASLPKSLIEASRSGNLVPFVGAGVSMAVRRRDGSRPFPSWPDLLLAAAERLAHEGREQYSSLISAQLGLPTPDYLEAAKQAKRGLGPLWAPFLREQLRLGRGEVADDSLALAQAVWEIGSKLVITTNYDAVLTWACPERDDLEHWRIQSPFGHVELLAGRLAHPTLWQLHGSIEDPTSLILTPDGYGELYGDHEQRYRAALQTLRGVFLAKQILFVGFSLDDPYVVRQLDWVKDAFAGCGGPHYVLTRAADLDCMQAKLDGSAVQPIPFADFGEPLLSRMREIADPAGTRRARPRLAPSARAWLVWEERGRSKSPHYESHLISASQTGAFRAIRAPLRGMFVTTTSSHWELRWTEARLVNQPIEVDWRKPPVKLPRLEPEECRIKGLEFVSANRVVSATDESPTTIRRDSGLELVERNVSVLGAVGPYVFVRHTEFTTYVEGASFCLDAAFAVVDLEQPQLLSLASFLGPEGIAAIMQTDGPRADFAFARDPDVDGAPRALVTVAPSYGPSGSLELRCQFTGECCHLSSDGQWAEYTRSCYVASAFIPEFLEAHRQLPAPVLAWRDAAQPAKNWGWCPVYDTHVDWCRSLFGADSL